MQEIKELPKEERIRILSFYVEGENRLEKNKQAQSWQRASKDCHSTCYVKPEIVLESIDCGKKHSLEEERLGYVMSQILPVKFMKC